MLEKLLLFKPCIMALAVMLLLFVLLLLRLMFVPSKASGKGLAKSDGDVRGATIDGGDR